MGAWEVHGAMELRVAKRCDWWEAHVYNRWVSGFRDRIGSEFEIWLVERLSRGMVPWPDPRCIARLVDDRA